MREKHWNVWYFFLSVIGFTWLFQLPLTLSARGVIDIPADLLRIVKYIPAFGPFLAAIIFTFRNEGKIGILRLLKRGWDISFAKTWWIPTLLLLPAMEGLAVLSAHPFGGRAFPELTIITQPGEYTRTFLGLFCLAILEEYGWRGYALVRLQKRWNALAASLILAAVWGPWHLQQWFMDSRSIPFLAFWYGIVLESILLTWLFNNTKGSLLPVILFHTLLNAQVFPTWNNQLSAIIFVVIWTIIPVLVIIVWGPRRLMRRKGEQS